MVNKIKTCVFISGNGSNLKSIIKNSRDYNFPINIELIISNNIKAGGLKIAKNILFLTNFFLQKTKVYLNEIACLKSKKEKLNFYV